MNKNSYLIGLSESSRSDFGRKPFARQATEQQVFSAIWARESEVNNGGFAQYFASSDGDTAAFAPVALNTIGAHQCAKIVQRALSVLAPSPQLSSRQSARQALVDALSEDEQNQLGGLDSEFYSYPDSLTELLFAFVSENPNTFGPSPIDA